MAATNQLRPASATTLATAATTPSAPTADASSSPDHSLADWLADVGAADLSPALVWPPTGSSSSAPSSSARRGSLGAPPPFMALQRRTQHEIARVNNQTRELLEHNWASFQEQVADGKELLARIQEEEHELAALQQQLDGEDAFLPGLIEQLTSHSKLTQAHQLNLFTIQLVTTLLELHTAVAALSELISHGALPAAVPALRALRSHVSSGVESWIASTEAYIVLRRWSLDEQVRLEGALAGSLEACFEFSSPATTTTTTEGDATTTTATTTTTTAWTLNLRNAIYAAPKGDHIPVEELWAALEHVYAMGREGEPIKRTVDTHLTRIAKQTIKYIVAPYLESNGAGKRTTELIYSDVGELDGAITISLQPVVDEQDAAPLVEECLKDLGAFLAFFGQHASLLPPSPYAMTFTQQLTPTLQSLVISSHLLPSLPSSSAHLESYLSVLEAARSFEADFLDSNGYFSFLPSNAGPEVEERRVIQDWIERVDRHWAKFVGDQALVDARKAIMSDDEWEGEKKDVEVELEEVSIEEGGATIPPPRTRTQTEQYLVSKRCEAILQVARRILDEAVKVASPTFPFPTFATSSTLLLKAFVSILSLYRATAPVHHLSNLSSSSALSLQFSNDLDYLATQIALTWNQVEATFRSDQSKEVNQAIAATRRMGKEMQDHLVMKKRDQLMDRLDEANAFLSTADDQVYKQCEEAVMKVMEALRSVVEKWKPVTNPTFLYTTLGSLVNDVLLRVLDEIEGQLDISEEESIRLNKLCKMLHGLEDLFEEGATSVGREVPVWFKFVFLSELLEASMADILFLFDNGHLVDFEPSAIAKLVRALFSDSPLRNRNLEHILNGHPTNVPNDDDETTTTDGGYSRPSTPPSASTRSRNVMGSGSAEFGSPARRGSAFSSTQNRAPCSARELSPPPLPVVVPPVVKSGKISLGAARITRPEPLLPPSPPSATTEAWKFDEEDDDTTKDDIVVPTPEPKVVEDDKPPVIDPGLDASFDTPVVVPQVKKEEVIQSVKTEDKALDDPWGLLYDDEPVAKPVAAVVEEKPKPVVQVAPPRTSRLGAKRVPVPVQQPTVRSPSPAVVVASASPPPAAPKPKIALAPARPIATASPPRVLASRAVVSPPPKATPAAARVLSPTPSSSSLSGGVPPPPRASSASSAASAPRAGASPRIRASTISPVQSPGRSRSPSARTASPAFSGRGLVSPPPPPFASREVVSPPPMRGSPGGMSSPPLHPIGRGSPSPSMHELSLFPLHGIASLPMRNIVSPPPPSASNRSVVSPPPTRNVISPPPMRSVISPSPMRQPFRSSGVISPQRSSPIPGFSPPPTALPAAVSTRPVQPTTTALTHSSPSPSMFSPPVPTLRFPQEEEKGERQDEAEQDEPQTTSFGRPRTGSYSSASGARTGGILGSESVSGGEDDWGIELELENGASSPLIEEAEPEKVIEEPCPEPEVEAKNEDADAVDEEESIGLEVERVALSEEESIGFPSPIPSNASLFEDHHEGDQRPRRGSLLIKPVFSTQGFLPSNPMPTVMLDDLESAAATTTSFNEAEAARAAKASTVQSIFTSPQTPLAAPPMTAQHSKHHSDPFEFDQLVTSPPTVAAVPKVLSYSPPTSMGSVLPREQDGEAALEPEREREETQLEVEEEEVGWSFDQTESGGDSFEHDAATAEDSIIVHDDSMEQAHDHDVEDEEEGWPIDDAPLEIDEEADLEVQVPQEQIEDDASLRSFEPPSHFGEEADVRAQAFSSSTESPILVSPPTSSNASQDPSIVEVEHSQPSVEEVLEPEPEVEVEQGEEAPVEAEPEADLEPEVQETEPQDKPVGEEDEMDQVIEDDGWGFSDHLSIPSPTQELIFSPPSPQPSPPPPAPTAAEPPSSVPGPAAAPTRLFAPRSLSRLAMKNLNLSSTSALSPTIRSPLPVETVPPPAPIVPSTSHMPTTLYSPLPTATRPDIVAHLGHAIARGQNSGGKYDIFPPTPTNERSRLAMEEGTQEEEEEEDGGWAFDDSAVELEVDTSGNDDASYFPHVPSPIVEDGVVKTGLMQPVVGRAQKEEVEEVEGGLEGDELDEDGWGF